MLIWGRAADLKVPICILCDTCALPDVEKVIERFADRVDVCIDHMADCPIDQPDGVEKLLALARYPRVFVKLSHLWSLSRRAVSVSRHARRRCAVVRSIRTPATDVGYRLARRRGRIAGMAGRWPCIATRSSFLPTMIVRWILGGTALRLWPFTRAGMSGTDSGAGSTPT